MELVHAWIGVIADEVVRISAVAGKTYVGGKEIEAKSISESDAVDGLVILRFGNATAQLRFKGDLDAEGVEIKCVYTFSVLFIEFAFIIGP